KIAFGSKNLFLERIKSYFFNTEGNILVALITGILNLILMLFVFKSLLAPILVSIIILLVVVAIVMFCFNN
ncbi:hypothetical protein P7I04_15035, partial [Lactococcus lactis]